MEGNIPASARPRLKPRRAEALLRACAVIWLLVCRPGPISAQGKPNEIDVKAEYLFNFARFLRFAPGTEPRSTFNLCILGRDEVGHTLDQITSGQSINKLPVRVIRISDATNGRYCSVLFISASEGDALREDMAILGGADVLTVGEAPDFMDHGGMIQFLVDGGHVRFAVNLKAVNRTHLSLSSELLRVAASVKGSPMAGDQR